MFKVGDKVRMNKFSAIADVVGVFGDYLWLKFRLADEPLTRLASEYELLED